MPDITILSLRGGLNVTDPPTALGEDQATVATNVEFVTSTVGERRRGSSAITLPASISGKTACTFLHRHLPTTDETESQLWALGATVSSALALAYKDTAWHDVTISDTASTTSPYPYQWNAQSLHGKLFLAYKSNVDRLHVWDGTSLRRVGLAQPAAPSVADTAAGGAYTTKRYFRVRYTVQSGGVTILRSEPSTVTTFTPSGAKTGATITKPASIGEGETHWEVEASLDNVNFYRIATVVVGTTTYDDTTAATTGYTSGTLSADSGDYTVPHSGRFVTADQDRLLIGGAYDDTTKASRVSWTVVYGDTTGVGNDERIPIDTDNFIDLDGFEGGPLTGMSRPVNGYIFVFKMSHIYKLIRTGLRTRAYEQFAITKGRGALYGSLIEAVDQVGNACLYFLDPRVGPCRLGVNGLQTAGWDIQRTWRDRISRGAVVVCRGFFYPDTQQVEWCIALDGANTPTHRIVLQTNLTTIDQQGLRKGWSIHDTGKSCKALAACLFSTNIESNTARSLDLKPFIGIADSGSHHIQMLDTGTTDDGDAYLATLTTRPFMRGLNTRFGAQNGTLLATAANGVTVDVTLVRDFGLSEPITVSVDLTPSASETHVMKYMDNLSAGELQALQITFSDPNPATGRWELHQLVLSPEAEETGGPA